MFVTPYYLCASVLHSTHKYTARSTRHTAHGKWCRYTGAAAGTQGVYISAPPGRYSVLGAKLNTQELRAYVPIDTPRHACVSCRRRGPADVHTCVGCGVADDNRYTIRGGLVTSSLYFFISVHGRDSPIDVPAASLLFHLSPAAALLQSGL